MTRRPGTMWSLIRSKKTWLSMEISRKTGPMIMLLPTSAAKTTHLRLSLGLLYTKLWGGLFLSAFGIAVCVLTRYCAINVEIWLIHYACFCQGPLWHLKKPIISNVLPDRQVLMHDGFGAFWDLSLWSCWKWTDIGLVEDFFASWLRDFLPMSDKRC